MRFDPGFDGDTETTCVHVPTYSARVCGDGGSRKRYTRMDGSGASRAAENSFCRTPYLQPSYVASLNFFSNVSAAVCRFCRVDQATITRPDDHKIYLLPFFSHIQSSDCRGVGRRCPGHWNAPSCVSSSGRWELRPDAP